jgi:hypothetical protein
VTEKNHVNKTIFNENKGKSKTKVPSVKLFNRQKAKKENALQNNLILISSMIEGIDVAT